MKFDTVNWSEVAAIFTLMVGAAGVVFLMVRTRLAGVFVSQKDFDALINRVSEVEGHMATLPSRQDVAQLAEKVSTISRELGSVGATVEGSSRAIGRVEHMMDMLIKQQLEREAD
jgi:hypothetical protein